MTDIVFWAGPVVVTKEHRAIDWYGRDVRIIPIEGSGSSHFASLGYSLRDSEGRILPTLLRKYAGGITPEKIALASYSAGWGLWNLVTAVDADRERVSALCLADSAFLGGDPKTGACGDFHKGYVAMGRDAVAGRRLLVSATAHTSPGGFLTGRQSWLCDWNEIQRVTGARPREVKPRDPAPAPSGGMWRLGSACYWGDYTRPGSPMNQGNDFGHEEQHYVSPKIWQAYLAPWLAGRLSGGVSLGALAAGAAVGALAYALRTKT